MGEILTGKTALVVGASRGLGRSVALNLFKEGANIFAVARTSPTPCAVTDQFRYQHVLMDMLVPDAPKKLLDELANRQIDIVVHVLGGNLGIKSHFCDYSDLNEVMRVNLGIAMDINNFLIPKMREEKWGRVVHISSVAAVAKSGNLCYGVAKAALNAYVENLGRHIAADGVIMSAIMPAAIRFPGSHWDNIAREKPDEFSRYLSRISSGEIATPEQVADIVSYLCVNESRLFAGGILTADGGRF